nr:PREDICTED: MICAL-like protein 2 isoform X1 [Bemisia tabaci]
MARKFLYAILAICALTEVRAETLYSVSGYAFPQGVSTTNPIGMVSALQQTLNSHYNMLPASAHTAAYDRAKQVFDIAASRAAQINTALPPMPQLNTANLPTMPQINTANFPSVSQFSTDKLPPMPQLNTAYFPSVSQFSTDKLPSMPQLNTANYPSMSQFSTTNIPSVSQLSTAKVPTLSQLNTSDVPTMPQLNTVNVPTTSQLNAALPSYTAENKLNTVNVPTMSQLNTALPSYTADNKLNTVNVPTMPQLNTALPSYAADNKLNTALPSYPAATQLNTALPSIPSATQLNMGLPSFSANQFYTGNMPSVPEVVRPSNYDIAQLTNGLPLALKQLLNIVQYVRSVCPLCQSIDRAVAAGGIPRGSYAVDGAGRIYREQGQRIVPSNYAIDGSRLVDVSTGVTIISVY